MKNHQPNTILVADDDRLVRRFVATALIKAGFQVIEAPSGAEATELIRAHRSAILLAICDILMPGLSGLDVAAELNHQKAAFPVLLITGAVDSIAVEAILLTNPKALLTKPFTAAQLLERVAALTNAAAPSPGPSRAAAIRPAEPGRKSPRKEHGQHGRYEVRTA